MCNTIFFLPGYQTRPIPLHTLPFAYVVGGGYFMLVTVKVQDTFDSWTSTAIYMHTCSPMIKLCLYSPTLPFTCPYIEMSTIYLGKYT